MADGELEAVLGDGLARGRLIVDRQRDDADVEVGELVGGAAERAQLGVAVRAPAAAVQQHDAEVAGERAGQLQRLAVGGGDGQRREGVAGVEP